MENSAERLAWIQLALMPYIGAETFYELCRHYGSAAAVWAAEQEVGAILPSRPAQEAWRSRRHEAEAAAEAALAWEQQANCRLLLACDADFPPQLGEGITAPPLLFARGNTEWLHRPSVAIVGSRHATPQAMRIAGEFGEALAAAGIVTVSGMAAGIDSAAHEGALRKQGGTVAVWGTGIDRVYPVANKALAHRIAEEGCVLSEFPLGTRPLAGNFPRRNRLIAALSSAVLVVEAALESGSLITARLAADMGREVFAVPGSIDNPHSKGCHKLIKDGAKLVECLDDIVQECPQLLQNSPLLPYAIKRDTSETRKPEPSPTVGRPSENVGTEAERQADSSPLLDAMGYDPVHPDTLAQQLQFPAADVYAELLELELDGKVASLAGGRYQRIET